MPATKLKSNMTISGKLAVLAILCAGYPALGQQNDWDITNVDVSKFPPVASQQGVTYEKDVQALSRPRACAATESKDPGADCTLTVWKAFSRAAATPRWLFRATARRSLLVAAASRIDDKIAMPPKRQPRAGGGGGGTPGAGGQGGQSGQSGQSGQGGQGGQSGQSGQGGQGGQGGPGGPGGGGPPPTPLTAEQVGLLRAWIDQGAK